MESTFRCYQALAVARGLWAGSRSRPHARTPLIPTLVPSVERGLFRSHMLRDRQNHERSRGMHAGALGLSKTGVGHNRRLFGQSALDSGPHERMAAKKKDEIDPSGAAHRQRDRSEDTEQEGAQRQRSTTWTRDSPAESLRRGRLLTTPSRSLKLLIPLPTDHPEEMETIATLVHSQQPLSYLERLIQAELSLMKDESGHQRPPAVSFIAYQFEDHPIHPRKVQSGKTAHDVDLLHGIKVEEGAVAGKKGEGHPEKSEPPDEEVDDSLGKPQSNGDKEQLYVRWSHATEVGDFIRNAARAGEFVLAIEGAPPGLDQIRITVPSFNERTYYLRMRLRKISDQIAKIATIKQECDKLAHRRGQRVALAGFGILASWWLLVYKLTFGTSLGWDTMEPVTYLVSLSTLMGGYLWFLYHNREISYRSALDFAINARQKKLYEQKGVDLQLWENLTYEGNSLRREIQACAADYEQDWDERLDERDPRVAEALKQKRNERNDTDEDRLEDKDKSKD